MPELILCHPSGKGGSVVALCVRSCKMKGSITKEVEQRIKVRYVENNCLLERVVQGVAVKVKHGFFCKK